MKLAKKFEDKDVKLVLDTEDGQFSYQDIPSQAAIAIASGAETLEKDGEDVVVDGIVRLPAEAFDFEGEEPKAYKKKSRPNKAELLEEAKREMTNPEIAKAVKEAKESPEKPHFTKNTSVEKPEDK